MFPWALVRQPLKQHLDGFGCFACTATIRLPVFFSGATTPKIATSPRGDLDPHLIRGSLGPARVSLPNSISIGSAVFAGHTHVTNRETDTDRPRHRVCSNTRYFMQCTRCGL